MSDTFTIRPATRQGVRPLIGFYSESGRGKTFSALLLARGFVGPSGKIVMIDSESGRGELYADDIPGGYSVLPIVAPFSPERYISAITAAEESGTGIIIVDSASHEWEGIGGVLDMALEEENRGMKGLGVWKRPKLEHAKLMAKMLQSKCPVIACVRAKFKSHQVKGTPEMAEAGLIRRNDIGKQAIIKDEFASPQQAEDFIFEMTMHAEIMPDHSLRITKRGPAAMTACFPEKGPITVEHGAALAAWCAAPSLRAPDAPQNAPAPAGVADAKRHGLLALSLWKLTAEHHQCAPTATPEDRAEGMARVERWLWDEGLLDANTETLKTISDDRLARVVEAVKARGAK